MKGGILELLIETGNPEETRWLGEKLADILEPGDVILLTGDLGAGKTTIVQGIARGLGVTSQVTSPTFVIVREYEGLVPLYHVDAYRVESTAEFLQLGYESFQEMPGVVAIEWGDRVSRLFREDHLQIDMALAGGDRRSLRLRSAGARWQGKLENLDRVILE
ncbi:MAG: tRNA (adenosine(37)-N6)-threonylcarbamoyltransferase complex ATPase subunit type 1 TsaE [Candidatus Geothermincolia bacterium]